MSRLNQAALKGLPADVAVPGYDRAQVKTGVPGMAYLRLDPEQAWPEHLAIKVPQ